MSKGRLKLAAVVSVVCLAAIPLVGAVGTAAAGQQTVTFNDAPVTNAVLNGQYPVGVVNWGTGVWFANKAAGKFTTGNLKLNGSSRRSGSVTFVTPKRALTIDALNRGGSKENITLACPGLTTMSFSVKTSTLSTLATNWTGLCSNLTITVANGNTLFDNLVFDDGPGSTTTTTTTTAATTTTKATTTTTKATTTTTKATTTTTRATTTTTKAPTTTTSATTTTTTPPTTTTASGGGGWWVPPANTSWDWQLATPVDQTTNVSMYDIDMWDNTATVVSSLHAKGRKVICYTDVGSWENYRADAAKFPAAVIGATYDGFPDEKWLDIRRWDVLGPLMTARFQMAKDKGCDGIEPDNIDGYDTQAHESSGFPLAYADQIAFNHHIADLAHSMGMNIGLKNDIHQAADLVDTFDWALSEQCFQYGECSFFTPFTQAGKAVFEVEYKLATTAFCPQANAMNFNSLRKKNSLNSYREACR